MAPTFADIYVNFIKEIRAPTARKVSKNRNSFPLVSMGQKCSHFGGPGRVM